MSSTSARGRRASARCSLLAALASALAGCGGEPPPRPNVLLVTIDTLRADRLSCAGYPRETTPHLDALAARGLRFTHAQSPRAKTTPALATLLTGLYPHDHGVRDLTQRLDGRPRTLAEQLAAAGYDTAAIVGNYVVQRELSGLDRGFARWDESLPDTNGVAPGDVPQRRATSLTDGALALIGELARARDKPWFTWLHYMDPHGAYDAPAEHRVFASDTADLVPDPAHPPPRGRIAYVAQYNVLASERAGARVDANAVRDRYDAEVRYVDAELGRLLAWLEAEGLDERTWIIVTADHGESLGEHQYWFEHGRYAYEATCRVPLVIVPPRAAVRPAATEARGLCHDDVSLADLMPTLLELVGVDAPTPLTGRGPRGVSRAALLRVEGGDGPAPARNEERERALHPVFCEKVERADLVGAVQTKAIRIGDWKLSRRFARRGRELASLEEELYDLASDPAEERDLATDPPGEAPLDDLRAALLWFCAGDPDLVDLGDVLAREREALRQRAPDVERRLRALGYR